jgi:hypothetical protein
MGIISNLVPYLIRFAAMIKIQNEPAAPGVLRVPGGRRVAIAVAALGFITTAVSIVFAAVPPDDEPNKAMAVVKVVGSSAALLAIGVAVYLSGRSRAGRSSGEHAHS